MDKRELINDMRRYCGGSFITRQKLAAYMGYKDPHCVDELLYGLERVKQCYFVNDVAESLKSRCVI